MLKIIVSSTWTLYSSNPPSGVSETIRATEAPTRRVSSAPTTPAPCDGTDYESCKMYAAVAVKGGLATYMASQ